MTKTKETLMNTQISTKLAALAVALMMNSLIFGSVDPNLFERIVQQTAQRSASPHKEH